MLMSSKLKQTFVKHSSSLVPPITACGLFCLTFCSVIVQRQFTSTLVNSDAQSIRLTTFPDLSDSYRQWLAGVIDGDGYIRVTKNEHYLEVTTGQEDYYFLTQIKKNFGGVIKPIKGKKAYRYRLFYREGLTKVVHAVNGHIRHTNRLKQLTELCLKFNIPLIAPIPLTIESSWFAGFFDADGCVRFRISKASPRVKLSVSVGNKYLSDVQPYKDVFGGGISMFYDTNRNGCYRWAVGSRPDILAVTEYFKTKTRSRKGKRFFLIEEYYKLQDLRAYKPDSPHHRIWLGFLSKWNHEETEENKTTLRTYST